MNIVSLVTQLLTPDMIAKIASALGVDSSLIGKAVGAAVPGILGGLTGVASTQDGSRKLFDAVTQQHPGVLDSLAGMIGGAGQKALVDNGSSMLSSLLGGSATSALAGAVGKYAGLGGTASSSLLGLLAPVVIGALGKQKAASGLDASGLAQLLTSQKSNIAGALPSGFADLLGGTGLLNSLGSGVTSAAQSAKTAAQSSAYKVEQTAKEASGLPSWAMWAIPLAILAALAWWFLRPSAVNEVKQAATQATQTAQNLTVGTVDVGSATQSVVTSLRDALKGVTDLDTAKAALPKLQDATAQLDKVGGLVGQLPAGGKSALAALVTAARPSLEELFNKVLAIPGVAAVAKAPIDTIRAKLDELAKASG